MTIEYNTIHSFIRRALLNIKGRYSRNLPCLHVVIDLQQQSHRFRGEFDGTRRDQQRLNDILLENIRDQSLWKSTIIGLG